MNQSSLMTTQHSLIGPLKLISTTSSILDQNDNPSWIELNDLDLERSGSDQRSPQVDDSNHPVLTVITRKDG